ncbi:hypothetical protein JB92DRAFT_2894969 [Gautieria morchelliformis]|nr:hypothetical protein JB92DRAFT_2894969 [Gautieria morchelliformis]
MQTVLQYLRTFILALLPPALPSALPGARPRSSSSPLHSSPTSGCAAGRTHIPTPCQRLYATSLLLEGEIEIRSKILIVGWGFRRPFPIAPQHP